MKEGDLRGEKVILREKRLADASDDYRWRCDDELARLDAAPPLRMGYQEFLRLYQEELLYPSPWSRRFAIETLDHRHIGNCMYYDIDPVRGTAELGILIGERQYWERGYGTDVVTTLLCHIFTTTPITKVYLHTLEWNRRARRCFEKCGFALKKTVRRNGQNLVYMEITQEEWLRAQEQKAAPLSSPRQGTQGPD